MQFLLLDPERSVSSPLIGCTRLSNGFKGQCLVHEKQRPALDSSETANAWAFVQEAKRAILQPPQAPHPWPLLHPFCSSVQRVPGWGGAWCQVHLTKSHSCKKSCEKDPPIQGKGEKKKAPSIREDHGQEHEQCGTPLVQVPLSPPSSWPALAWALVVTCS